MIRNVDATTERLYLSKKVDQTIYIEYCKIPQHHLDGVRFLYRQYKKKKPGVIINEKKAFSRNLQIVLFVKAICHILEQPVLILCQEGAEHGWIEQFQTWTDLCDDLVVENQKPHIQKKVLINTLSNLPAFCSRNWSVLIIDMPDMDKTSLQVLGLPFKADYKIWITPINLRGHLDQFSRLYKWLYPKMEFDKSKFIPNKNTLSDVVDKAILLDAFMEDIVGRYEEDPDPFQFKHSDEPTKKKISLKNKDSTGTKIKRSKRKIYDDDDDIINNVANNQSTLSKKRELEEDFSIDNFKRKRKSFNETVSSDKESDTSVTMDTLNSQSELNLFYEPDSSSDINSDRLYEVDTIAFGNDTCDKKSVNINETENDNSGGKENNSCEEDETKNDIGLDEQEKKELFINKNNMFNKSPSPEVFSENNKVNIENDIHKDGTLKKILPIDDEIEKNTDEIYDEHNSKHNTESLQMCEELNSNTNSNKIVISDEVQIESNCKNVKDEKGSVTNNASAHVINPLKHKCIDDKLKDLEEKVMKRFKGSILDSLI